MDEPLLLFRDAVQNRIQMREMNVNGENYYVFGDIAYPASTTTSFQSMGAERFFYTLEAIVQCWNLRNSDHNVYVKEVSGKSIQVITLLQKRRLVSYLSGEADTLLGVVNTAPFAVSIPVAQLLALARDEHDEPELKRQRLEAAHDVSTNEDLVNSTMEVDEQPSQDEGIRALNQELDAEKVAQLRNRVKKNLKQVKPTATQDEVYDGVSDLPFEDGSDDDVGKALAQVEVAGCSRMQLYNCDGLDLEGVMEYITESLGKKNKPSQNQNARPLAPANGNTQKKPAAGYSRYDQEVFRQELDTDFHIDTDLSFHGPNLKALNAKPLPGQIIKPPPSQPVLRPGFGPASALHPNGRPPKRQSKTPIIVIPASGTALITMYNVEDILQELRFVSSEERKKQKTRRESDMLIHRRKESGSSSVPFRIIEDPRKLKDDEWDRVVAVFVQGPAWQFKGWRFGSQPTEIFARICAFHLKFDEQPLDKNVAQWSVNVLSLSQTKRHMDRAVLQKFWTTLDRYLVKNKPHLRF